MNWKLGLVGIFCKGMGLSSGVWGMSVRNDFEESLFWRSKNTGLVEQKVLVKRGLVLFGRMILEGGPCL